MTDTLQVNMGAPVPGIFRLELRYGPLAVCLDLPNEQAQGLFGAAVQKLAAAASRILVVPGMPPAGPPPGRPM